MKLSVGKKSNIIISVQLSFCCMGVCTMLITTAQDGGDYKYEILIIICSVMGLFDGCFVTLIGPIAFDLCGPLGASQAIGSLLGLFSIPMTVGPPVAGIIYDKVHIDEKLNNCLLIIISVFSSLRVITQHFWQLEFLP